MTGPEKKRFRKLHAKDYATVRDFCTAFSEGMNELYQLAFLLTADHQMAEHCFVAGLESVTSNRMFKEWARSWAKRTIIQNGIRELMPRPPMARSGAFTTPQSVGELPVQNRHFKLDWILALGDFDRFVFVMSVLEHYSDQDCALLLDCSPQQVEEARVRAVTQFTGATAPMH